MIEVGLPGEVLIEGDTASDAGRVWLDAHPGFVQLVGAFLELEDQGQRPEFAFSDVPIIGVGDHSEVRQFGGMAVKLSTPTTGRYYWKTGVRAVENLASQYTVLGALGTHFDAQPELGITVPQQMLAMRTPGRSYIRVEEHVQDCQTVYDAVGALRVTDQEEHRINEAIKARIKGALGNSALLRLALKDIGLGRHEFLHSKNVLIPRGAMDITGADLCIIDQPSMGIRGRTAAALLGRITPHQAAQPATNYA